MIEVKGVSKEYRIYKKTIDRIKQIIYSKKKYYTTKKAVENVTFEIRSGEAFGIVGRNGSGKSTLLQLIAGTLNASKGDIKINGRIAALLELGSGFNPEFTGRENICVNAMLIGLRKSEIEKRMADIVEFADIGEYIDRKVSTYSSGMIVRLAFAVIANVDADILIIDEALAVGDAYFTQKCMRFIKEFKKKGCILLVSHDANAIMGLCDRAILLKEGSIDIYGSPKQVIERYTRDLQVNIEDIARMKEQKQKTVQDNGERNKEEEVENQLKRRDLEKWSEFRHDAIQK